MLQGKHKGVYSYLFQISENNRIAMVILIIAQAVISLCGITFVLCMRYALDYAEKHNKDAFLYGLVAMIFVLVMQMLLRALYRHFNEKVKSAIENNIKARALYHLLRRDYAQTKALHSGEWMNRLTSDSAVVSAGLTEILPNLCGMAVKLFGAGLMIMILIPKSVLLVIAAAACAIAITVILRKYTKKYHKAVQEADGSLRSFLQERLGSMMVVRAYRAQKQVEKQAKDKMDAHQKARMDKNRLSLLCHLAFSAFINLMYVLCFAYCGYGILQDFVTYGTLLAVLQLIGQIQSPLASISGFLPQFYSTVASAERLLTVEEFDEEKRSSHKVGNGFSAIYVDHVSFSYNGELQNDILSNVSTVFRRGDFVALTGQSGCGKSTLFKLLLCMFSPEGGELLCESEDGTVPLTASHRKLFAYVPQGNHLFGCSVRDIVSFSADRVDDDRIWHALEIACAKDFVSGLEKGIDTVLEERGGGISEGQMQRLAIARAVYADAPILLLDESTSALDAETERQVLSNLRALNDKTVLIVTHRPAALSVCDRTLEFTEDGIIET